IVVSDTGQGIAPHMLPHVFERFRQADSSPTRAHGGLGLGLALVKHLVELHGGSAAVDRAGAGRGGAFTVRQAMGFRVARRPGALRGGDVPAVAVTAYGRVEDHVRSREAGYDMHITKPVEPGALVAVVANLVKRSSA